MWTGHWIFSTWTRVGKSGRSVDHGEWTLREPRDRTDGIGVSEEAALNVTEDETSTQTLLAELRESQAKLDAARAEAASLKVLLAVRSDQHDKTWQARQRLAARLAADAPAASDPVQQAGDMVAEANERTEAVRTVLGAVLACVGSRALDRRRFQTLIAQAGREAPDHGPGAARHAVLLTEARRVLGIPE